MILRLLLPALLLAMPLCASDKPVSDPLEDAWIKLQQAEEQAALEFDVAVSKALVQATKIELYVLDFEYRSDPSHDNDSIPRDPSLFPISGSRNASKILSRKTLSKDEMAQLMPSLQKTVLAKGPSALCHFPIHGIRIWKGDRLWVEASLCYVCKNGYVRYGTKADFRYGKTSEWCLTIPAFQQIMEQLMPIPKSGIERFEKLYPGK